MGTEVSRGDGTLSIRTPHLHLRLDLQRGRWDLDFPEHRVRLAGFGARAVVDGRELGTAAVRDVSSEDVERPDGAVTRVRLVATLAEPAPAGLALHVECEIGADGREVAFDASLAWSGSEPLVVDAIDPLHWESGDAGELSWPGDPQRTRFYRLGYQSWTPSGWVSLSAVDRRPRIALLRDLYNGPFTPLARRGLQVSDCATCLRAPGSPGLALGFVTHARWLNHVSLGVSGGTPASLSARCSTEGTTLSPGDTLRAERLWLRADAPDDDGIEAWATRCGSEMNARVPERSGAAWCSWYQFFTKVTADDVMRSTRRLREQDARLDVVQLDDGFQTAVGDWRSWDPGFPDGIAPVAREIREAGYRAGLWLAPLLVSRQSQTAQEHEDWLLRRPDGKPRVALVNKDWKGKVCYALDPTHPEVLAHLESIARAARADGFDYLKLDFLYAGTLPGLRHDPTIPTAAAYRGAIEAIRRGAGEDVTLVGCGAPLGPSIGLFEAMRIGPDVAPYWATPITDRLFGVKAAPAAVNSIRNVLARAPLHRRLWLNDPDCALLRDADTKLSEAEVRTLTSVIALSGGPMVLSDDPDNLSPRRRRLQARLLPPLQEAPRSNGGEGEIPDRMHVTFDDGSVLVLRVNLGDAARPLPVDPVALGVHGRLRVYDAWNDRVLPEEELGAPEPTPAHGCRLLRLVPHDGRPQVIGSTLHFSAGARETAEVEPRPGGGATVRLALPGLRRGGVTVALPERSDPVRVHVGFEDETEFQVEIWPEPPGAHEGA